MDKLFPVSMLVLAIALYASREGSLFAHSQGLLDSCMIIAMLGFIGWLLWRRAPKG